MAERSGCVTALLVAIAIVLIAGFYFTIDATDLARRRSEELVTEMKALRSEVSRLRDDLRQGEFATVADGDATAPTPQRARFANADLRDPAAVDGGGMVTATQSETHNFNPLTNNESSVSSAWELCNDTLATRNMAEPTRFEPQLATHWEISDDKLTYTLHLRKGVTWHDVTDPETGEEYEGMPVTAHDVKFYVDTIKNPGVRCESLRVYYKALESVEVVDDHTLKITWKEPYFLSREFTLGLMPLPRHFYGFDPEKPDEFNDNVARNRMIVGCGPYRFVRWDKGKEIVFTRNEAYYGPRPHLVERRLRVIKDPNSRLLALRNGELDRIGLLPDQWVEQTNDKAFAEKFTRLKYTSRVYTYIGYNLERPLFKDRRVRLAMTHCVDRRRILKDVYRGLGRIVTGNFFIDSPYYNHAIEPWPFDIAKAKALLAEAGWTDTDGDGIVDKDGKPFEFTFLAIAGSTTQERFGAIIKEDMARAGVRMNINPIEWSVYTQRLEQKNFDVCSLGWSMGYESDPYQIWHSSQADRKHSSNHISFRNAEADRIIEIARRTFDLDKRIDLYHRFHEIMHEQQPYTFLLSPYSLVAQDDRYRNVVVYPLGLHTDSMWVPLDEQKY